MIKQIKLLNIAGEYFIFSNTTLQKILSPDIETSLFVFDLTLYIAMADNWTVDSTLVQACPLNHFAMKQPVNTEHLATPHL